MQIVDTRIRNLPTAVRNDAAENFVRAADLGYQHTERRRAEDIATQQQEAARLHDEKMARLQSELRIGEQKDAQGHEVDMLGRRFGQEKDLIGINQNYDWMKTQGGWDFERGQREADRALARRGQDQQYSLGRGRLALDGELGRGQLQLGRDQFTFHKDQYTEEKYRPISPVAALQALRPFGFNGADDLERFESEYKRLDNLQRSASAMPKDASAEDLGDYVDLSGITPDEAAELLSRMDDPKLRRGFIEKRVPPSKRGEYLAALQKYEAAHMGAPTSTAQSERGRADLAVPESVRAGAANGVPLPVRRDPPPLRYVPGTDATAYAEQLYGRIPDPAARRQYINSHVPAHQQARVLDALQEYEANPAESTWSVDSLFTPRASRYPAPPPSATSQTDSLIRAQLRASGR